MHDDDWLTEEWEKMEPALIVDRLLVAGKRAKRVLLGQPRQKLAICPIGYHRVQLRGCHIGEH
jgi:hypothetical protein